VKQSQELRDRTIAYALFRVFLGVNIALHGISRLLDSSQFRGTIEAQFAHSRLPHPVVSAFALILPWAESLIGVLVFAGLWTRLALVGGALVMIALTFGSCLIQDWQIAGIQLVYEIAYFLLLFHHESNRWSADAFLRRILRPDRTNETSA
jgi:thiosulfate dehydrogenase (quinone) large subunit